MVAGGVVLAVGLAGAILLVSTSQSNSGCMQTPSGSFCPPPSSSGPDLAGGIAFSTAGLAGAALVAAGLADHQKGHAIARADAEIYAARYNRALLRKIGRETSQRLRRGESTLLRVPPAASPRSMGLSGLL